MENLNYLLLNPNVQRVSNSEDPLDFTFHNSISKKDR